MSDIYPYSEALMQAIHEYDVQASMDEKAQVIIVRSDSKEYTPELMAGK